MISAVQPQFNNYALAVRQPQAAQTQRPDAEENSVDPHKISLDAGHEIQMDRKSQTSELTDDEQQQVQELKSRDSEVRTHEGSHLAAAGGFARGGIALQFQIGPNGVQYAVGGHVSIDTSSAGSPEATIAKMQTVQAAAMAPSSPSAQDLSVAGKASMRASQARMELSEKQSKEDPKLEKAGATTEVDGENPVESPVAVRRMQSAYKQSSDFNQQKHTFQATA